MSEDADVRKILFWFVMVLACLVFWVGVFTVAGWFW